MKTPRLLNYEAHPSENPAVVRTDAGIRLILRPESGVLGMLFGMFGVLTVMIFGAFCFIVGISPRLAGRLVDSGPVEIHPSGFTGRFLCVLIGAGIFAVGLLCLREARQPIVIEINDDEIWLHEPGLFGTKVRSFPRSIVMSASLDNHSEGTLLVLHRRGDDPAHLAELDHAHGDLDTLRRLARHLNDALRKSERST